MPRNTQISRKLCCIGLLGNQLWPGLYNFEISGLVDFQLTKISNRHWLSTNYLAPTEGWSDRSQNCLHDMRIVGNT